MAATDETRREALCDRWFKAHGIAQHIKVKTDTMIHIQSAWLVFTG
jgi:hypothetical protein